MKTAAEIEVEFTAKLDALLAEYSAELDAKDYYDGHPECGEDVRMTVYVPAVWNELHEMVSDSCEINLGAWRYTTGGVNEQ